MQRAEWWGKGVASARGATIVPAGQTEARPGRQAEVAGHSHHWQSVRVVREAAPSWGAAKPEDGGDVRSEGVPSTHDAVPENVSAETSEAITPDYDVLQSLGDEIAVLAAHIHAATHRLLVLIARFDRLRGWESAGFRSCAHWLAYRTGIGLGAAREKARAARALEGLPETSAAMARGELSFSKVRALTRVATPECEGELLEVARASTARNLERFVRAWRTLSREDEARAERLRHRLRRFSVVPDDDGMYVVRGRLDPEVGAVLMRAVEAASDALYAAERRKSFDPAAEVTPEQRRADAVGLLAERALAAGFGGEVPPDHAPDPNHVSAETCGSPPPLSGTRAERYQVFLHVDRDTLDPAAEPGRSNLEDGIRVSAETSRRLTCDAAVVEVERGGARPERGTPSPVLDVGRRTRTVPPAIRRALEIRDRGCRFPGCGLRFADAHHVKHWADGGRTRLGNLVLLCRFHHRLVHEEGWRVVMGEGGRVPVFVDPRGRMHGEAPPRPALQEHPLARLRHENRRHGADPDYRTATARHKHSDDILPDLYERALRSLDAGREEESEMTGDADGPPEKLLDPEQEIRAREAGLG